VNRIADAFLISTYIEKNTAMRKKIVTDLDECRVLWNSLGLVRNLTDFWEFRLCFHRHFGNQPHFLVLEDGRGILGMLPLAHLAREDVFVFFPGETWQGKTWLERTPIYCREPEVLSELLCLCPPRTYLRYMEVDDTALFSELETDEVGYLLYPPDLDFSLDEYYKRFNWKKLKAITKEIDSIFIPGSSWSLNRLEDYQILVQMNKSRFGPNSYFHDPRFTESFRDVVGWLQQRGWLRMVSLEICGQIAAVDLGAVFDRDYVVFLGGTRADFKGVAKVMNMHHIRFALEQELSKVDFLCGDFYWKKLWHLNPQPLYKFISPSLKAEIQPATIFPTADVGASAY
jgi:hypothetical protein